MKTWEVKKVYNSGVNFSSLTVDTKGNEVLKLLLENRGISGTDVADFLNPPTINHYIKNFSNDLKSDFVTARKLIEKAVEENRPIFIHGDYDADGVCATAILYITLTTCLKHQKTTCFVPNRFDNGYGLSESSLSELAKLRDDNFPNQKGLIITVDCGITANDLVIAKAHQLDFEVLITDHHQKGTKLPKAEVIVWTDQLVGAGISLVLSMALGLKDKQVASLAGIATVTDLVSLRGINRSLVKMALEVLNTDPPLGIKCLLEAAGRTSNDLSTYDLGFVIGPRLNAAGRLESATEAIELLTTLNATKAGDLANKINQINIERQALTHTMSDSAIFGFSQGLSLPKILVVTSETYHEGIVGLVAGNLVRKYYRPSVVITFSEALAKGSVRSIPGVDIIALLRKMDALFDSLGGHPMAAGFSIKPARLAEFKTQLLLLAETEISTSLFTEKLAVDLELSMDMVTKSFVTSLEALKPYGVGNSEPIFCTRGLSIVNKSMVGKTNNHLILRVTDGINEYKTVYFDYQGEETFEFGDFYDLAYSARLSAYRGVEQVEFILKDIKTST